MSHFDNHEEVMFWVNHSLFYNELAVVIYFCWFF